MKPSDREAAALLERPFPDAGTLLGALDGKGLALPAWAMLPGVLIQFTCSLAALAALVVLASWLGKPRPLEAITAENIGELLELDAPGIGLTSLWIAEDARSAIARSGVEAVLITRLGDGYVIRTAPWSAVQAAKVGPQGAVIRLRDDSAPVLKFALPSGASWPPHELS